MNTRIKYWTEQYRRLSQSELIVERESMSKSENTFSLMTVRYANDPIRYREALEQATFAGERIEAIDLVLAEMREED